MPPPQPTPIAATSSKVEIPKVEEDAVVTPVPTERQKPDEKEEKRDEVVLDFTDSTAAPVTTGNIQPIDEQPAMLQEDAEGVRHA